ncbi:uncharacterized protein LOC113315757 [Papaver somniferum]|uniref:uncharacterized protein LOC113315757 n=1 Tax=Papaver somniferum TaxID=3469 RepID=UPI000E6F53C5|nr:uncharacterized protein LOC113315757 [Papaver somniferum]
MELKKETKRKIYTFKRAGVPSPLTIVLTQSAIFHKTQSDFEIARNLRSGEDSSPPNNSATVFISDVVIDESLEEWKFSLIGRLDLVKLKLIVAETNLRKQWKFTGKCQIIPIGRGFFIIKLENGVDMKHIYEGFWEVETQVLRLRYWERDFKPELQKTSSAFVWVVFPGLSIEYWKENILMTMGTAIRRSSRVDDTTLKKEIGYYASILVEVDLSKANPNKVWIESKYGKFEQAVRVYNVPKFCNHCKMIGYYVAECRIKRREQAQKEKTHDVPPQQHWRYTPKKAPAKPVVGFDIFPPPQQNIQGEQFSQEAVSNNILIPFNRQLETIDEDNMCFSGSLDSTQEFPQLSVEKLLEFGSSIPPIHNITPITTVESAEVITAQVLSNLEEGEWKDVSGKATKARKLNVSKENSSGGKDFASPSKFNVLLEVDGKQEPAKNMNKPSKGKIFKTAPNVVTRKQANNSVGNNSVGGSSNASHNSQSL